MDTPEFLSVRQVAAYLQVSDKTVHRMVKAGRLPAGRVGGQWRFRRDEIDRWFQSEVPRLSDVDLEAVRRTVSRDEVRLWEYIRETSVRVGLGAGTREEGLHEMVALLGLPPADAARVLSLVREREATCSTGIGEGIAIPHPRVPALPARGLMMAVGTSRRGIPWDAIDGKPVHLVFLFVAPSEAIHLLALARLNRLLRRDKFLADLRRARSPRQVIAAFRSWANRLDAATA